MRRGAAIALAALPLVAACGPHHSAADLCLEAAREGPPAAELACPEGTEAVSRLEPRRRLDRIPGPGGKPAAGRVAERRWCQGPDGPLGPYVGLGDRRRVLESGSYGAGGEPEGAWIVWDPRGRPVAVSRYREGRAESARSCAR